MTTRPPLSGLRVVDLSVGIAGAYCTKIVADGGADVIKIEPPSGDPLRRWSASGAKIALGDDGALFRFLATSKQSVVCDPGDANDVALARRVVDGADAIVWSPGSPIAELEEFRPSVLHERLPGVVIAAVTPFGLDGPWADRPSTEFTLQAWSGAVATRGSADRPPVSVGGRLGEWAAGTLAAVGLIASCHRRAKTGVGELVDVSTFESIVFTQTIVPMTWLDLAGTPWRSRRSKNLPDIHRTKDGYVGFMPTTGQQWLDFAAMLERPDWAEERYIRVDYRIARRDEMLEAIDAWCAERTTDEIVDFASIFRIPVAAIGNGETVTEFDHFRENNWYLENPGSSFIQPDVPYTLSNGAGPRPFGPAPRLGEHTAIHRNPGAELPTEAETANSSLNLPYQGLRVLDLTAFWAGPIVANVLGILGADVTKVESTARPDGMRYASTRSMADAQFWEWCPMFQATNTNKRGVTLNLGDERGCEVFRRLVAESDVIIENYTPRVMEQWGFTYDVLRQINPAIIMLRMPAFGTAGPWRDRGGYAQTMEQVSGLAWLCGYPDEAPQVPNGVCDPIGGLHSLIGLLLAIEHRDRTGEGMGVEAPQVGGALNVAAELAIEHSAYGALLTRDGNRGPTAAPQNLYLSADEEPDGERDRWVAIAIEEDEQWRSLRQALGEPAWSTAPELDTVDGRRAALDEIDRELEAWCGVRRSDDIVEALWAAGVPVAKVMYGHEHAEIPQLEEREWLELVDHPVIGSFRVAKFPVRMSGGPKRMHRRHAPTLGGDNQAVLTGAGLTLEDLDALAAGDVIGSRPSFSGKAF